jgi:hypothetical protein
MSNESKPPTYIVGRLELQNKRQTINSLHRAETLLYQQQVAALIECARTYAHNPSDAQAIKELLRVAAAFKST